MKGHSASISGMAVGSMAVSETTPYTLHSALSSVDAILK